MQTSSFLGYTERNACLTGVKLLLLHGGGTERLIRFNDHNDGRS